VASVADTALEHEIARFPIAGGGMVTGGHAVSINALITNHQNANPQNYAISEIGFYGVDGANNTMLFAIHRQGTLIINKVLGVDISMPFVLGLVALPINNMTVQIDTNASAMLALLGQHTASAHPHTQYKRTLDNSERLKIAAGVDSDDAVNKGQMDDLFIYVMDKAWPIGTTYENAIDDRNPSHPDLLGFGTWIRFAEGRTTVGQLDGDDDFSELGDVGGFKNVTLTAANIPFKQTTAYVIGTNDDPVRGMELNTASAFSVLQPFVVTAKWYRTA